MGSSPIVLGLRAAQLVFAIIVLGLSGYVISWYYMDTLTASPSTVNFMIFAPLFAFASIVVLELAVPVFSRRYQIVSHPLLALVIESLNLIFWNAGWIAMVAFLRNLVLCRGTVCAAAKAATVFGGFSALAWLATTVFMVVDMRNGHFRKARADGVVMHMKQPA